MQSPQTYHDEEFEQETKSKHCLERSKALVLDLPRWTVFTASYPPKRIIVRTCDAIILHGCHDLLHNCLRWHLCQPHDHSIVDT